MNKGHKTVQKKKKNHIQALSNSLEARCRRVFSAKQDYNLNPSNDEGALPLLLSWKPVSLNENNIENDLTKLKNKYTRSCQEPRDEHISRLWSH